MKRPFFLLFWLYSRWDGEQSKKSWKIGSTINAIYETRNAYYLGQIIFAENNNFAIYSINSNDLLFYSIKEEQEARIEYGVIFYRDRHDQKQCMFFALELHLSYLLFANGEKEIAPKLKEITQGKQIQYVKSEEWRKLPNGFQPESFFDAWEIR